MQINVQLMLIQQHALFTSYKYLSPLYNAVLKALHIGFQVSPHPQSALCPQHKGCASSRPSSHFEQCDATIWSWERQKYQPCPKIRQLKTSILSTAVKHLNTCGSLRNNRNYVAQLSTANPKNLRLFTWRKAGVWHFRSDLTAPNHKSVRKTAHPVFQETLHMWEMKFSQARISQLLSSMWWITRIFREVKNAALIWFPAPVFPASFWKCDFPLGISRESKNGF